MAPKDAAATPAVVKAPAEEATIQVLASGTSHQTSHHQTCAWLTGGAPTTSPRGLPLPYEDCRDSNRHQPQQPSNNATVSSGDLIPNLIDWIRSPSRVPPRPWHGREPRRRGGGRGVLLARWGRGPSLASPRPPLRPGQHCSEQGSTFGNLRPCCRGAAPAALLLRPSWLHGLLLRRGRESLPSRCGFERCSNANEVLPSLFYRVLTLFSCRRSRLCAVLFRV